MKKAIIKRRKRVIPAPSGCEEGENAPSERAESPLSEAGAPKERGSVNPDGSVNLGIRPRQQQQQPLALVPEAVLRQNKQGSPLPSNDLGQYHASNLSQPQHVPDSLTDENRLAPLTSIPMPSDRQSSLSPASFLSPSRKRSFSAAEMERPSQDDADPPKRLSSIKSILNPTTTSPGAEDVVEQRQHLLPSPGKTPAASQSPGAFPSGGAQTAPQPLPGGLASSRDPAREAELSKAERRAILERETERMRQLLAAKERELAELAE